MLEDAIRDVERELRRLLSAQERPRVLMEAMRWAVEGGGKRIRPRICLASAIAVGGASSDALMPACAVELLHSYTLVHDDLPAMDNDAERRGRPSVWAKFGEANAILAGDALQALAFAALAQTPERRSGARAKIIEFFADCALGVVRGQVEDIAEGAKDVSFIYEHKTADLFMAAAVTGALAGGGDDAAVEKLRLFAYHLGVAFQYEDDLLDDDSPFDRDETAQRVQTETNAALAALVGLPGDAAPLADLARSLVNRTC
jgi:geranylgeranyl diphosphate synthase type II